MLAVLPQHGSCQAGGILISGSAAGNSPIPNNATYVASKAFANTFSESLRGELARLGCTSHCWLLTGPHRDARPRRGIPGRQADPGFPWISVEHTAQLSLDGLERNKMRVVPGVTSKAMSVAVRAPRDRHTDCRGGLQEPRRRLTPTAGTEDAAGDLAVDDRPLPIASRLGNAGLFITCPGCWAQPSEPAVASAAGRCR